MAYTIPSDLSALYIEVNSVPLNTTGWRVLNGEVLLGGPSVRGADLPLPAATGQRARRKYVDLTRIDLHMQIYGAKDGNNGANADHFAGLIANVNTLRTNVVDPVLSGDGTRTAVVHYPDASTKTAAVHVISPMTLGFVSYDLLEASITVEIPSGWFA